MKYHHCQLLDETEYAEKCSYQIYNYEDDREPDIWYYFTGEFHHEIVYCPFCGIRLDDYKDNWIGSDLK